MHRIITGIVPGSFLSTRLCDQMIRLFDEQMKPVRHDFASISRQLVTFGPCKTGRKLTCVEEDSAWHFGEHELENSDSS